jgi:hypothetical protein
MYRPGFVTQQGLRSIKVVLGPPAAEPRVSRPRYECYFFDEGLVGAALFGDFFLLLRKRHSRTSRGTSYKVMKALVREKDSK